MSLPGLEMHGLISGCPGNFLILNDISLHKLESIIAQTIVLLSSLNPSR